MLKDITLGQYFPGDSCVHRLDPRFKLVLTIAFIVILFCAVGPASYGVCAAFLLLTILLSRVRLRMILKGLKPLLILIIFTAVLNILYTPGNILWQWGFLKITDAGLIFAVKMVLRIVLLIIGTSLLTYTTSPIMLTDAIESLLNPLKRLRVPVHELAMMMTIALRFIPTLIEETDKIMSAQRARGADFESGNIIRRAKSLIPLLVPLFISAFRRADELAIAMECRCYNGGEGRTRLHQLKAVAADWLMLAFCVFIFALIAFIAAIGF